MEEKIDKLKTRLKVYKSAVIEFSGGVDSTFLARIARDVYGQNLLRGYRTGSMNEVLSDSDKENYQKSDS